MLSWDSPDPPGISELAESLGRLWVLSTRCQKGTRLESADSDDLAGVDGRGRENLSLDEGETMTAEDVPRPGSYVSRCVLQFTQILLSMLCSEVYKDATNN